MKMMRNRLYPGKVQIDINVQFALLQHIFMSLETICNVYSIGIQSIFML